MATNPVPGTGLQRILQSIPLPQVPQTQLEKLDPAVQMYIRALNGYLRGLLSALAQAQAGFTLPPIPDPAKNYVLSYVAASEKIEWIEWTSECSGLV